MANIEIGRRGFLVGLVAAPFAPAVAAVPVAGVGSYTYAQRVKLPQATWRAFDQGVLSESTIFDDIPMRAIGWPPD